MQAYYNSVFELLAEWGVDFVKYDWIEYSPEDIVAVANARKGCGRDIVLSLSSGGDVRNVNEYYLTDMARVTSDVWDDRESLIKRFDAMSIWGQYAKPGFWLDLDMIPIGIIRGRSDTMSLPQKETFMTQTALAASPMMYGGDLILMDSITKKLLTNSEMLACNQNAVCAHRIYNFDNIEIWKSESGSVPERGWIGIFNRNDSSVSVNLSKIMLGLDTNKSYNLIDIWKNTQISDTMIQPMIDRDGVLFISYSLLQ